jgi:hypothetical protein
MNSSLIFHQRYYNHTLCYFASTSLDIVISGSFSEPKKVKFKKIEGKQREKKGERFCRSAPPAGLFVGLFRSQHRREGERAPETFQKDQPSLKKRRKFGFLP